MSSKSVPEFQAQELRENLAERLRLRDTLEGGIGAAVVRDAVSEEELDAMRQEFADTIAAARPKTGKVGGGPPGSNGCSIAKDCGFPQSVVAWTARLAVVWLYRLIYDVPEDDAMCTSMDALFYCDGATKPSTLKPHYDYSEHPESSAQKLRSRLRANGSPVSDAVQGILVLESTEGVGTVLDTTGLDEDEDRRKRRCGPQPTDKNVKDAKSCFRILSGEDLANREWSAPQGGAGSLVLWNSRTAHSNRLPVGGKRKAAAVCWAPAYVSDEKVKKVKREQVANGGGTNHWPNECCKNGSVNAYYNSPKQPDRYWKVPDARRQKLEEVERYL